MLQPDPLEWRKAVLNSNIAIDEQIATALSDQPIIVYSLSGGKDSSAAAMATNAFLDTIGHPPQDRYAIHADLGLIEWPSTSPFVASVANRLGTPLSVVRNSTQGLLPRWRQRFENAKRRYRDLESYALIGPWSSSSLRFCTSETKVAPIGSSLAKAHRGRTIISVVGIRREESHSRAQAPISRTDTRFAGPRNRHGTQMLTWHPIIEWDTADVFDHHAANDFPLHEAYTTYGLSRLSCAYCIMASAQDITRSIASGQNDASLREVIDLEIASTFSFQPGKWLSDFASQKLTTAEGARLSIAKQRAGERRALEAGMPSDLRFTRGWPPRIPDHSEATVIAEARAIILSHHRLENRFPSPEAIIDRFAELHAARRPENTV